MENVTRGVDFSSAHLGEVQYTIYIPPEYEDESLRFPVLYLLHGGSGNHETYVCLVNLTSTINDLVDEGSLGPMIIVMPDGDTGWWVDRKDGTKPYESFLMDEFIPYIDSAYRTISDGQNRAVGGLSMGGFGAFSLAFRYLETFRAAAATSPAIPANVEDAETFIAFVGTFGFPFDESYYGERDPLTLAETTSGLDALGIYFDIGDSDAGLPGSERLHEILEERDVEHTFDVYPGGHDYTYFNEHIDELLVFMWSMIQP